MEKNEDFVEKQKEILEGRTTDLPFSLNALQVVAKRYLIRDEQGNIAESPEEMIERVAKSLSQVEVNYGKTAQQVEQIKHEFFDILQNFEFTPAGRTIANAGAPTRLVSNCIVLHINDSMDSIFQTLKEASLLQQAGSGLGFPLHLMRPAGNRTIKSRGCASGPVSFLKVYNSAFGVIKQQNRHGANMGVMRVDHPDILEFVHAKEKEGEVNNFNISVGLTNKFMEQVKRNDPNPWMCEWNGTKMLPRRITRNNNFSVTNIEEVNMTAREMFQEIIECAWKNGEPGCVFLDKVNETNPVPGLGRIEACNPCVTGDSLVSTEKGLLKMSSLVDKFNNNGIKVLTDSRMPVEYYHSDGMVSLMYKRSNSLNEITAACKTGIKPVWKVTTKSGYELEATEDHKVMTNDGWVKVGDLIGKEVLIQSKGTFSTELKLPFEVNNTFVGKNSRTYSYNFPSQWSKELGQCLGWLVGDGWIRNKEKEWTVGMTFGEKDKEILEYLKTLMNTFYGFDRKETKRVRNTYHLSYGSKHFVDFFMNLGVKPVKAAFKEVPESIFVAPKAIVAGFLQGLFSADGTVSLDEKGGNYYVRLTSKSQKLVKQVQLLLLHFGIKSKIYDRSRPARDTFSYTTVKGEEKIYESDGVLFEVQINKSSLKIFSEEIGFLCNKHNDKLEKILQKNLTEDKFTDKVNSVEYIGEKEVYDLTEPLTHSFICNSMVVSNCGEQFLHDGDVCNLGSINLEKFASNGEINYPRLREVTRRAVRMLDNVIDLSDFPVDKVNNVFRGNRRIGLGIMGFADLLYKVRIPYNSPKGFDTAEKVMGCIQRAAHEMSQELAEEKGTFPNWEKSVYFQKGIKMRNAALTNIAPTGTISMVMDVSGGVEPYFALAYHYQGILGGDMELYYTNKHLREELEKHNLFTEEIMEKITKEGSLQNIAEIPEETKKVFVTSMDISSEDHTRMQAAFQRHLDNAISKTVNFPNSATKEDVLQGYVLAWELGCKGCTVYRDGSREVQVLNLNKVSETANPETKSDQQLESINKHDVMSSGKCPECSGQIQVSEGCYTCLSCGFSACSI